MLILVLVMSRKENLIIKRALIEIAKLYKKRYDMLLNKAPDFIAAYYKNKDGYYRVQEVMNRELKMVNEFAQLEVYNKFADVAYLDAIKESKIKYGLNYNFSQVDQKALEALKHKDNWFVSKYQTLTDQEQSLKKLEELWESGESVEDATAELKTVFQKSNKRINKHTKTTLITKNTQTRSRADLNTYEQNDITTYIFRAVIDKVTTDPCRKFNGKRYSVVEANEFQKKIDNDVNSIIRNDEAKNVPNWKTYNKTIDYLQKNDSFVYASDNEGEEWETRTIKRTSNPETQGKKTVKKYRDINKIPGKNIPRTPLHENCRSRLDPDL
jgi:SPP1 gp7 family putative phage head morphogenesis protein